MQGRLHALQVPDERRAVTAREGCDSGAAARGGRDRRVVIAVERVRCPGVAAQGAPESAPRRRRCNTGTAASRAGRVAGGSANPVAGDAHRVLGGGSTEAILPNRSNGITIIRLRPIMFEIGTAPCPRNTRVLRLFRNSPIIHSSPAGTVTGPNGACRRAGPASGVVDVGLSSGCSSTNTRLAGFRNRATVSPPTAMTRLTKSFSSWWREPDEVLEAPAGHATARCRLLNGELAAPVVGPAENHDVPGLRVAEPVGDLVNGDRAVYAARAAVQARTRFHPRG